jgi:hypothetical protein
MQGLGSTEQDVKSVGNGLEDEGARENQGKSIVQVVKGWNRLQ